MTAFKIVIIGSGLAGNLLANGLINNNVDVEIYERLPITAKREGYQIRLGENALKGFRACLTEEQSRFIVSKFGRASNGFASAPILYDHNFRPLLDLNAFPNYDKSAPISRKILRDILAEPVEKAGRLFYDKAFSRYEVIGTENEKVRVHFEDGTSCECDVLIAADGAHSRVNKQVGLDNLVQLDSEWSFYAKNNLPTARYLQMSEKLVRSPILTMSKNRGMFYCAYLPDQMNRNTQRADVKKTSRADESISSSFFAYGVPVKDCPADVKEWPLDKQWDYIREDMKRHWCPEYQEIVDLLQGSDLYVTQGRASKKPPADWRNRILDPAQKETGHPRVLLLGDAIHAMMPMRGMGGNQSLLDTTDLLPVLLTLAKKAKQGHISTADMEAACKSYECAMMPRAFGWVAKSGGHKGFRLDVDTWAGYFMVLGFSFILNLAYVVYSVMGLFRKNEHLEEAPEFDVLTK